MGELRISDVPAVPGGGRRVRVSWREERALPREAEAVFSAPSDEQDWERVRWYLEDYAEFPADPAPAIAREAEAQLAQEGADLFRQVFEANRDTMRVWEAAAAALPEARVEVDTDPGEGAGLAWELLRDPGRDQPVALGAGAFVRTHLRAAAHAQLPEPAGDRLRVLLVIARPGGREDVPFRSVASRLVRGGAEQMVGLDLDVLRPATFARLWEVLRTAHTAGRPYHVVHFDGHGTWLDLTSLQDDEKDETGTAGNSGGAGGIEFSPLRYGLSVVGPVRPGQHGYLLFENPGGRKNQQLVGGPTLGRLLSGTGVPVLVLNACRSAYSEAPDQPAAASESAPGGTGAGAAAREEGGLTEDVHARIRAYGSLAAEVADMGVPGVVAMRYNVYVVTAAQFAADLYAHLLAGKPLGQAVTAARQALAADPVRQIGAVPVSLQDWAVPVVYESAPLVLLRPPERAVSLIKLTSAETTTGDGSEAGPGRLPRSPDAGFFGRDETLLALDRAFDTQPVVLLHAFAGAGKSTTAAEFARWYTATGGLDYSEHPKWRPDAVLWSSFEHHLTAGRAIDTVGDCFAPFWEANGIPWAAVTDPGQRRNLVLQALAELPVLWVWDNVEPVTGFPVGTPSDWTPAERDELADLLRDLAQNTRCKVLLTSRRDERTWLGDLPARIKLPAMPMRESLQLAAALAARYGHSTADADWRPLLRYAAGNPLTITVLAGQALRGNLTNTEDIENFVARLQAGEARLEEGDDAALGRTRSLAASLSYGFAEAFTDTGRARLAVLHLFRDTAHAETLCIMGEQKLLGEDAIPALAGLDRDAAIALLDRAAGIGLLESLGRRGFYRIHPALPWYFTGLFTTSYGPPGSPPAARATRAYTRVVGALGRYYHGQAVEGYAARVVPELGAGEANLRHALDLARAGGLWEAAAGCLQGLLILYERTGRNSEWARLVAAVTPDVTDLATGAPLPGREEEWNLITSYRVRIAWQARDWPATTTLQTALLAWNRDAAAAALAAPPASLTPDQRGRVRNLAVCLEQLGHVLREQADPGCLPYLQEALGLLERIGSRAEEANLAIGLGNAYLAGPGLRDLDQAEHWFEHSLRMRPGSDQLGQATSLAQLGAVALQRFDDARAAGEAESVMLQHLNAALRGYRQALDLTAADDHESLADIENQLGTTYARGGDTGQALRHYQQAIQHNEACGHHYGAGQARYNIALLLDADGRISDALQFACAALHNYEQGGPGAAGDADRARRLIADLEQRSH